ncbi:MAG: radical SAM protein [Desulfobacterales bacterium]|nr:radical SAM protein [Desulfobacterales bacterium]
MKYIFGPVNSRRLGRSLGIDLLVGKVCSLNCVYCEVGATTTLTCERREYTPTAGILAEIDDFFSSGAAGRSIDAVTITGSGEPCLHSGLGRIIRHLKAHTAKPVVVLTNGTLLHLAPVREELAVADIVIPSLDSALAAGFRKVNRPAAGVELAGVIQGLTRFCREFTGQVWLEILLVKGMNDSAAEIAALAAAVAGIGPDRVQLNSVARPPLESFVAPVSAERLTGIAAAIKKSFTGPVDILVRFKGKQPGPALKPDPAGLAQEIIQMLRRRPCTAEDIREALALAPEEVAGVLKELAAGGRIQELIHNNKVYFQV